MTWKSDGQKHWITSDADFPGGSLMDDHRAEVQALLSTRVDRFIAVFRPRMLRLVRESGGAAQG